MTFSALAVNSRDHSHVHMLDPTYRCHLFRCGCICYLSSHARKSQLSKKLSQSVVVTQTLTVSQLELMLEASSHSFSWSAVCRVLFRAWACEECLGIYL